MKHYIFTIRAAITVYTETEAEAREAAADVCIGLDVTPGFYSKGEETRGATINLPASSNDAPVLVRVYDESTGQHDIEDSNHE